MSYESLKEIITDGGKSLEQLKATKDKLRGYFEKLHADYDKAAVAYKDSYDNDVLNAAELLGKAEDEALEIQIKIENVNAEMPKLLVSGDSAKISKVEAETQKLEAMLNDKEKRIKMLNNYQPSGDDQLYNTAALAYKNLTEAYRMANELWSSLVVDIRNKEHELELMAREVGSEQLGVFGINAVAREEMDSMRRGGAFLGDLIDHNDKIKKEHEERSKAYMEQRARLEAMGIVIK